MGNTYNFTDECAYIAKRALAEGSIPLYLEKELGGKLSLTEFADNVLRAHLDHYDWIEKENIGHTSTEEEVEHVVRSTGYSSELVEMALWFYECFNMANGNVTCDGHCLTCGHDKLFVREGREMYDVYVKCARCKAKVSLARIFGDEDDDDDNWDDIDDDDDDDDAASTAADDAEDAAVDDADATSTED